MLAENESKLMAEDNEFQANARQLLNAACDYKYSYNFEHLGRPIIQFPDDIVAVQEIIWQIKPDLIIETGIAHGGSLVLSASMLALLDYCDALEKGELLDPAKPKRRVIGVDIDIRQHNRDALDSHPMRNRMELIEGSSVDQAIVDQVRLLAKGKEKVLVMLDSNHTHDHVAAELAAYADLVTVGSFCIVFDTVIEYMDEDAFPNRDWSIGNNPMSAVQSFLENNKNFEIDKEYDNKLLLSVAPSGYLKRVS